MMWAVTSTISSISRFLPTETEVNLHVRIVLLENRLVHIYSQQYNVLIRKVKSTVLTLNHHTQDVTPPSVNVAEKV